MTHTRNDYYLRPPKTLFQFWLDPLRGPQTLMDWIFRVPMQGKLNVDGDITLTANVGSTTITDPRIGGHSVILFMPLTANAAAEVGNGTMYVSSVGKETATITHANNAQTDREFHFAIFG